MQVKMKTILSGPAGNAQPGETINVSDEVGASLVAGGYADEVQAVEGAPAMAETADIKVPETAVPRRTTRRA